jgi:hypothetical protein
MPNYTYDLLVYAGLLSSVVVMVLGMMMLRVDREIGVEIRKIRLSAATLLGILTQVRKSSKDY